MIRSIEPFVAEVIILDIKLKKHLTHFLPKKNAHPRPTPTPVRTTPPVSPPPANTIAPKAPPLPKSRRTDDMSAESELACFLDQFLYGQFPNSDTFGSIERVYNKEQQLSGIDVVFQAKDGRIFHIDEKAQLYYLNKDIPTFAFEIDFLRNGVPTTGWLCNNALETDLYLLIWPFATHDTPKGIKAEHFTKADCLLVQKSAVLHLLDSYGLSVERLLQDAKQFRRDGILKKIPIPGVSGIYYYASDPLQYKEAPINIVISKQHLMRIKQRRYIVTSEKVEVK